MCMGYHIECKTDDPTPRSPEDGATAQCRNCAEKIRNGEIDESMGYKWKKLTNYPDDLSCPDCGAEKIHPDPRAEENHRGCMFRDGVSHPKFCCRCGTWMYIVPNVDVSGWKCPDDNCGIRKLG
jgi:hypothetical protein